MPTMRIYKNNTEIESIEFRLNFEILQASYSQRLFWQADYTQVEEGGGIRIWIKAFGRPTDKSKNRGYIISFVLPEWRLLIDGVLQEQRLYDDMEVTGKEIELDYNEYRFVCWFPPADEY